MSPGTEPWACHRHHWFTATSHLEGHTHSHIHTHMKTPIYTLYNLVSKALNQKFCVCCRCEWVKRLPAACSKKVGTDLSTTVLNNLFLSKCLRKCDMSSILAWYATLVWSVLFRYLSLISGKCQEAMKQLQPMVADMGRGGVMKDRCRNIKISFWKEQNPISCNVLFPK